MKFLREDFTESTVIRDPDLASLVSDNVRNRTTLPLVLVEDPGEKPGARRAWKGQGSGIE